MSILLWTVLGCGPPDYDGWQDYLVAVQARFEQDGSCDGLTELPASMMDGNAYESDPLLLGGDGSGESGQFHATLSFQYFAATATGGQGVESVPCEQRSPYTAAEATQFGEAGMVVEMASYPDVQFPQLRWTGDALDGDRFGDSSTWLDVAAFAKLGDEFIWDSAFGNETDSCAWICIDSIVGPAGTEDGPPTWRGLVFAHAETWTLPDGSTLPGGSTLPDELGGGELPLDLADIDCANSENASWSEDPEYCYNWGSQCDGIDNDLDGEIDEGDASLDSDGNGVPDCQDDWDGDGIPNHQDDDVEECCCNY